MNIHAQRLTELWETIWTNCAPDADQLKYCYPNRWVRFHSLPDSKRYPESEAEYREGLQRYHTLLGALGVTTVTPLLCVTEGYSSRWSHPLREPDLANTQPDAWQWRQWDGSPEDEPLPDDEPTPEFYDRWVHQYVAETTIDRLDPVLRLVADDQCCGVMVLRLNLAWVFHPYDGGTDVIAATEEQRNQLRSQYANWTSPRDDGL